MCNCQSKQQMLNLIAAREMAWTCGLEHSKERKGSIIFGDLERRRKGTYDWGKGMNKC